MSTKKKFSALAVCAGFAVGVYAAPGITWYGGELDHDWQNAANWSGGAVPTTEAFNVSGSSDEEYAIYSAAEGSNSYQQIYIGFNGDGRLDVTGGRLATYQYLNRIGVDGDDGILNISGGIFAVDGSNGNMGLGADPGTKGVINLSSGAFECNVSYGIYVGQNASGGEGELHISGGSFSSVSPLNIGNGGTSSGVMDLDGSSATVSVQEFVLGNTGTLQVRVDAGGVSTIEVAEGGSATLGNSALLEPYFVDGTVTGKWTVLSADSLIDEGLVFTNLGDSAWSYIVTNNELQVWYGMGDSGYDPDYVPIVYTNGAIYWDGEAGDNDFDNPTNWAGSADGYVNPNNILPLVLNTGAQCYMQSTNNYAVYTSTQGSRYYSQINVGVYTNGIFVVTNTGSSFTLKGDSSSAQYIGKNGYYGELDIYGNCTVSLGAAPTYIGEGAGSVGVVNLADEGRFIAGRESGRVSILLGTSNGGSGTINIVGNGRLNTRCGITLANAEGTGSALFSVTGAGATIGIGAESSLEGAWMQESNAVLQVRVTEAGLSTIQIVDKDPSTSTEHNANVYFNSGSKLDVGFSGFDGENGSWDVMTWDNSLLASNLTFSAGVDTNVWSFEYVDTDATNGVDTLRITAVGLITEPTVQPNITAFSMDGTTVTLVWDSEAEVGYNVLSKNALDDSTWTTNVGGMTGSGASMTTNLAASGTAEFFTIEAFAQ